MSAKSRTPTRAFPSRDAVIRAVASSTAIETGERISSIEAKLRSLQGNAAHFSLAFTRPVKSVPR